MEVAVGVVAFCGAVNLLTDTAGVHMDQEELDEAERQKIIKYLVATLMTSQM